MKKAISYFLVILIILISFSYFTGTKTNEVPTDSQASAWLQKHIIDSLITGDSILVIDCTFQQNVDWYDNVEFTLKGNGATTQTDSADTVIVWDNKSSKNIIVDYAMKKSTYTKYY